MSENLDPQLYNIPIREHPAPFGFETRGIDCPDGVTRLLTYPKHIWDWHDHFFEDNYFSKTLTDEIQHCWDCTKDWYPDKNNEAFPKIFYFNIISKYKTYNGMLDTKTIPA